MATSLAHRVLIIEPFYGGSHKQLIDLLYKEIGFCDLHTLPAKKWHWRARTSALHFSQTVPRDQHYDVLFCSSVLNLAELVALRPDLAALKKIIYFHENQLVYPVRKQQDRDFQYGYNQILSCLVADMIVFNSSFNKESFLSSIQSFLKLIPDHRPKGISDQIKPKTRVLFFPIAFPSMLSSADRYFNQDVDDLGCNTKDLDIEPVTIKANSSEHIDRNTREQLMERLKTDKNLKCSENDSHVNRLISESIAITSDAAKDKMTEVSCLLTGIHRQLCKESSGPQLVIGWAHRWEHDKDPDLLFRVLYQLKTDGLFFKIAIMGEMFTDVPAIFSEAEGHLKDYILHWGYMESKGDYYKALQECDVILSTAKHEFYGVAMLEATYLGCYPLAPNDLVYPEIFPKECLYNTENQLLKRLKEFCHKPWLTKAKKPQVDFSKHSWSDLRESYMDLLSPS